MRSPAVTAIDILAHVLPDLRRSYPRSASEEPGCVTADQVLEAITALCQRLTSLAPGDRLEELAQVHARVDEVLYEAELDAAADAYDQGARIEGTAGWSRVRGALGSSGRPR
jgi:hypothetical protein